MSDAGDIVTAVQAVVDTALSITSVQESVSLETLDSSDFPYARVVQTGYAVDLLERAQEQRQWTISVLVAIQGDTETREDMAVHLEAIRDGIIADRTLGFSATDRGWTAYCEFLVPESHTDTDMILGVCDVFVERGVGWRRCMASRSRPA